MSAFVIVRDARGSLVHVRTRDGECVGCIEAGLYEIVRALVLEEAGAAPPRRRAAPLKRRTDDPPAEEEDPERREPSEGHWTTGPELRSSGGRQVGEKASVTR